MINNLYENGQFGGIPKAIFNLSADTDGEDGIIFVCELLEGGFTDTDKEGNTYTEDDSNTLIIDNKRIRRGIDSGSELKRTLRNSVHCILCSYFEDSYGTDCSFGTIYSKPDSMLIAQYLQRDYSRLKRYKKPYSKKCDIIRELELDFRELTDKLISLYSPEQDKNDRLQAKKTLEQYDSTLSERIEELERELEELRARQTKNREDIERIDEQLQNADKRNNTSLLQASRKAIAEDYIQGIEKIRQELNSTAQSEESLIPEEIRRKAQPFIEKGLIEEVNTTDTPPHYRLLRNLTGSEFYWINNYLLESEHIEGLSLNERIKYIWSKSDKQLSKSSHNKIVEPPPYKFEH